MFFRGVFLRRVLLFLVLFLVFAFPATAEIRVEERDCVPVTINGGRYRTEDAGSQWELASVEAVAYEVYHLQSILSVLKQKNWPVYVVQKRCFFSSGEIAGCAVPGAAFVFASKANAGVLWVVEKRDETGWWPLSEEEAKEILRRLGKPATAEAVRAVRWEDRFRRWETRRVKAARTALASPYLSAYVAAHEVGHLVRFGFLSESNLREYLRLRGLENMKRKGHFDDPEEIFAEDFRWLFGSERANQVGYRPSCPEPGDKEKAWFHRKLNTSS
ncbi:MAG: hypothetical protein AB1330_10370 [Bacillota bacterium]